MEMSRHEVINKANVLQKKTILQSIAVIMHCCTGDIIRIYHECQECIDKSRRAS